MDSNSNLLPCDSTQLVQQYFHCWKHFWKFILEWLPSPLLHFALCLLSSQIETLSTASSAYATTRNYKEPCLKSREPGEPETAWPRNSGSDEKNRTGRCHFASTSCPTSIFLDSCTELYDEDDRGPLDNTVLAFWHIFMMHSTTVVKKNNQHHFDFDFHPSCFLWPWGSWKLPMQWLSLGLWVVLIHPRLITSDHSLQDVRITIGTLQHILHHGKAELSLLT